MEILLDTHILLWFVKGDARLPVPRREMIINPSNHILVSLASLWEIAIKTSLGKLDIPASLDLLVPVEMDFLNTTLAHILLVQALPFHHKDPFDRMLIAQALTEDIHIMTDDPNFPPYRVKLI
ncbi:MAG: type II toxin-antitoxin system VapC family toxin [Saprospiraceae bacterium]|nr:MAG: type II toxin-antitoxin system VapC family toxin [Saprospiraceae bacterium]